MIGNQLGELLFREGHQVTQTYRMQKPVGIPTFRFDLCNDHDIQKLDISKSDYIFITAVNKNSGENSLMGVANIDLQKMAKLIDKIGKSGCPFYFFSSSQVFDGKIPNIDAAASYKPINDYGKEKMLIEKQILSHTSNGQIIRLGKIIGTKPNIFDSWKYSANTGGVLTVHPNLHVSPLSTKAISEIIAKEFSYPATNNRIHQFSSCMDISYLQIAIQILGNEYQFNDRIILRPFRAHRLERTRNHFASLRPSGMFLSQLQDSGYSSLKKYFE